MTAFDSLGPQFHASPYAMKRGTVMTPATNAAHGQNFDISSGNTYFTPLLHTAQSMGAQAMENRANKYADEPGQEFGSGDREIGRARIYQVQPQGQVLHDSNFAQHVKAYESPDPVTVVGRKSYFAPGERDATDLRGVSRGGTSGQFL